MADVILRGLNGQDKVYCGGGAVKLRTVDGGSQIFSEGETVENVPVVPDFSGGDQLISAPAGMLVRSAVLQKPEGLIPENIAEGVDIAGVIGTFEGNSSAKLAFGSFVGTGNPETVQHGLGVVPDAIYIGTPSVPRTNTGIRLSNCFAVSAKLHADANMSTFGHLVTAYYSAGYSIVSVQEANALDETSVSGNYVGIHSADEVSFSVGTTGGYGMPRVNFSYVWLAIGGLT